MYAVFQGEVLTSLVLREHLFHCPRIRPYQTTGSTWACTINIIGTSPCGPIQGIKVGKGIKIWQTSLGQACPFPVPICPLPHPFHYPVPPLLHCSHTSRAHFPVLEGIWWLQVHIVGHLPLVAVTRLYIPACPCLRQPEST